MSTADCVHENIRMLKKIFSASRKAKVSEKLSQMIEDYFPSKGLTRNSLNKVKLINLRTLTTFLFSLPFVLIKICQKWNFIENKSATTLFNTQM